MMRNTSDSRPQERRDYIGEADLALLVAPGAEGRRLLLEEKRARIGNVLSGMASGPYTVLTADGAFAGAVAAGMSEPCAASLQAALDAGIPVNGCEYGGRVFVVADCIRSVEHLRTTYVHEREHALLPAGEAERLGAALGREGLAAVLKALAPDPEAYAGRSLAEMAGEAVAYAMEVAYAEPEGTLEEALRRRGVENGLFIGFINERYNGQRNENGLSAARCDAPVCQRYGGRAAGVYEKALGGSLVEGQGAGPDDGRAEGAEGLTLERLGRWQKRVRGEYPSAEMLEALAPHASALGPVEFAGALRINRRTLPILTKWFDAWYERAEANHSYRPVLVDGRNPVEEARREVPAGDGDIMDELAAREDEGKDSLRDEYRRVFLDYIATLEGNALQLATAKWFCNGSIALPEDQDKVVRALAVAEANHVDPHTFRSPMELITKYAAEVSGRRLDPDDFPEDFTNRKALANGVYIYDVPDTGRETMRRMINTHLGKKSSPWCLLQGDDEGHLTKQSANYWEHYSAVQKRVAFKDDGDGVKRLVAFHASSTEEDLWWDTKDASHKNVVPVFTAIPDDPGGKKILLYSQESGAQLNRIEYRADTGPEFRGWYRDVFGKEWKSDRKAVYIHRSLSEKGQTRGVMVSFDGEGLNGDFMTYYAPRGDRSAMRRTEGSKVQGMKHGPYRSWYPDGTPRLLCSYSNNAYVGDYRLFFPDGSVHKSGQFSERMIPFGEHRVYYSPDVLKSVTEYDAKGMLLSREDRFEDGTVSATHVGDVLKVYWPAGPDGVQHLKMEAERPHVRKLPNGSTSVTAEGRLVRYWPDGTVKSDKEFVDKRRTLTREYRQDGSLKAEEWNIEDLSGHRNRVMLRTYREDGSLDRLIVDRETKDRSLCMQHAPDGSLMSYTERGWTIKAGKYVMVKSGLECVYDGGTVVVSRYDKKGDRESGPEQMPADSALTALGTRWDYPKYAALALAPATDVSAALEKIENEKRNDDLTDYSEDLPYRVEGLERYPWFEPMNVAAVFGMMPEDRQCEIMRELGLKAPSMYGLSNYEQLLGKVVSDSCEVTVSAEALIKVYNDILDYGMWSTGMDSRLKGRAETRPEGPAVREPDVRFDNELLNIALPEDAQRMEVLGAQQAAVWGEFSDRSGESFMPKGCARDGQGRMIRGADGAALTVQCAMRMSWLPVFLTIDEIHALGCELYCPNVDYFYRQGEAVSVRDSEGRVTEVVRCEKVYNIADTTLCCTDRPLWEALKKEIQETAKKEYATKLYKSEETRCQVKAHVLLDVIARNAGFREHADYISMQVDTAIAALVGETLSSCRECGDKPDAGTAFRISRAIGDSFAGRMGSFYPQDSRSVGEMVSTIREGWERQRAEALALAQAEGQGMSSGRQSL